MKINTSNTLAVSNILNTVQKGCSARCIDLDDVKYTLQRLDNHLSNYLYKKDQKGVKVLIDVYGGKVPQLSKWFYTSTQFTVVKGSKHWFITNVSRGPTKCYKHYPLNLHEYTDKIQEFTQSQDAWSY